MALTERPNAADVATVPVDEPTPRSTSAPEREPTEGQRARGQPVEARHRWWHADRGTLVVLALAAVWAAGFGFLAVQRHLAGGSHAEDLGFTDQVIGNFLRGQWFRMTIYQGATWNTELDVTRLARPNSLFAFHFEPLLLLFVPLYALGGGATLLLALQAVGVALGALPAYRLARHAAGSALAGVAVAAAYLLSPFGQWAVLADLHTLAFAAPLLLLAVERLVVARSLPQALAAAALAAIAREDVGLAVAAIGVVAMVRYRYPRAGLALLVLGLGCSGLGLQVIRAHSGGVVPFDARYGATLGAGVVPALQALIRPTVLGNTALVLLTGGWLGVLAPLALLPALPSLAFNALSTSTWMMAGMAHYSALVLPFVAIGAAAGLARLRRPGLVRLASVGLVLTSLTGYVLEGAGPLGANYAPASPGPHATRAASLSAGLPTSAAVSATSALVPRISNRAQVYVFPAVEDADFVFLDVQASPAPTSAADVYARVRALLEHGGWRVDQAEDGLLVLRRVADAQPTRIEDVASRLVLPDDSRSSAVDATTDGTSVATTYAYGRVRLLDARLVPSPDGAIDVDGPRWILRTVWQPLQPLLPGTRLEFSIDLRDGRRLHVWDIADLWWNPPERWATGQPVRVDIPDMPVRQFASWQASFQSSEP